MPLEHITLSLTKPSGDNGDDWDEFCHNAARLSTIKKAIKPPPSSRPKALHRKTAKTMVELADEPLLQANPHHFVLLPVQHSDIWRMYKKLPSGPLKKLTFQPTLRIGIDSQQWNSTSSYMFLLFLRPLTASSTRISVATLQPKSHHWKPDASTAFRSLSKTSTARRTRSSLTVRQGPQKEDD